MIQREMGNETGKRRRLHSESYEASDCLGDHSFPIHNPGGVGQVYSAVLPKGRGSQAVYPLTSESPCLRAAGDKAFQASRESGSQAQR